MVLKVITRRKHICIQFSSIPIVTFISTALGKRIGDVEAKLHSEICHMMEVNGHLYASAALPHWVGGWVGPTAGLHVTAKKKSFPCHE